MGLSTRYYILQEDGALRRVARRVVEGLTFGTDAIPEYTGTRQRVAHVLVESEGGKPVRILDVTGSFWTFDAEGRIDVALRHAGTEWMNYAFSPASRRRTTGRVVDLVPELKRRELEARHRWSVTQDDVDRIAADIWPGVHGPASDITAVKGKAPRRPPLSWAAKDALIAIAPKLAGIDDQVTSLTEAGLRGFAFEAERHGSYEDAWLWMGVAEHARRRRAILAARRTGRGEWYAVVRAVEDGAYRRERVVAQAHAKAASQREAVEAGRRLATEKADWLGPDTRLHVVIVSALEWQPEEE